MNTTTKITLVAGIVATLGVAGCSAQNPITPPSSTPTASLVVSPPTPLFTPLGYCIGCETSAPRPVTVPPTVVPDPTQRPIVFCLTVNSQNVCSDPTYP